MIVLKGVYDLGTVGIMVDGSAAPASMVVSGPFSYLRVIRADEGGE